MRCVLNGVVLCKEASEATPNDDDLSIGAREMASDALDVVN